MRAREASRGAVLPRTAPYLGVACLALLAITGAYTLPADLGYLAEGHGFQTPPVAWLAGGVSPVAVRGAAALLAHRAGLAGRASGAVAVQAEPAVTTVARALARLMPISPLTHGALSVPALLVAVTLAVCH